MKDGYEKASSGHDLLIKENYTSVNTSKQPQIMLGPLK